MPKLCSAQQSGRGSRGMGGDYQGIRSLTEGSSAQRWVLAYICRDTEVPQLWWQQLWCHDSRWAVIEWDTMELGAKLRARTPLRGSSSSSSHQTSSSAEKRTAASHSKTPACGVLIAWEEGPTGVSTSTIKLHFRKEKHSLEWLPGRVAHTVFFS